MVSEGDAFFEEERERCDKCGKLHTSLVQTEKGSICRKCFSKEKEEFYEESEDAWWDG
jgi:hypothetical protein